MSKISLNYRHLHPPKESRQNWKIPAQAAHFNVEEATRTTSRKKDKLNHTKNKKAESYKSKKKIKRRKEKEKKAE